MLKRMWKYITAQGTISILFGCHSIVHSISILIRWYQIYGKWPEFWEIVCIFLHDIGHIGRDYLSKEIEKDNHWKLGARIACSLFGPRGMIFIAAHYPKVGFDKNKLFYADVRSYEIVPRWWVVSNAIFEPKLKKGKTIREAVDTFIKDVRKREQTGIYVGNHDLYLTRK